MNIGFDFHGVLNLKDDKFRKLAQRYREQGHSVHILTGPTEQQFLKEAEGLVEKGVHYDYLFSISDYLITKGHEFTGSKEFPVFADDVWNDAKGEYAFYSNLDEHYDDFEEYGKYFPDTCKFFLVVNGEVQ